MLHRLKAGSVIRLGVRIREGEPKTGEVATAITGQIERQGRNVTLETLESLAAALEVEVCDLFKQLPPHFPEKLVPNKVAPAQG